jgi:hypothetical protein
MKLKLNKEQADKFGLKEGQTILLLEYQEDLVSALKSDGWSEKKNGKFEKTYQTKNIGGELNPSGKVVATGYFEEPAMRYFVIDIGWNQVDFDGRNYASRGNNFIKDIEKEIDGLSNNKPNRFINKQR